MQNNEVEIFVEGLGDLLRAYDSAARGNRKRTNSHVAAARQKFQAGESRALVKARQRAGSYTNRRARGAFSMATEVALLIDGILEQFALAEPSTADLTTAQSAGNWRDLDIDLIASEDFAAGSGVSVFVSNVFPTSVANFSEARPLSVLLQSCIHLALHPTNSERDQARLLMGAEVTARQFRSFANSTNRLIAEGQLQLDGAETLSHALLELADQFDLLVSGGEAADVQIFAVSLVRPDSTNSIDTIFEPLRLQAQAEESEQRTPPALDLAAYIFKLSKDEGPSWLVSSENSSNAAMLEAITSNLFDSEGPYVQTLVACYDCAYTPCKTGRDIVQLRSNAIRVAENLERLAGRLADTVEIWQVEDDQPDPVAVFATSVASAFLSEAEAIRELTNRVWEPLTADGQGEPVLTLEAALQLQKHTGHLVRSGLQDHLSRSIGSLNASAADSDPVELRIPTTLSFFEGGRRKRSVGTATIA